jgi:hypothetical protein
MDANSLARLRVYALLCKLEEMGAGLVIARMSPDYGAATRYLEKHNERISLAIQMLAVAAGACCLDIEAQVAALRSSLEPIKPMAPLEPLKIGDYGQSTKHFPERGFTGYCSNRNKYGPRKPKRK